jgi:GrpB-like predicted nucleotidyltransferase (UPF0157 family)
MKIELVPYDSHWPLLYAKEHARIAAALQSLNPTIEHIGSTSVPSLYAKPIIDVMVGLNAEFDLTKTIDLMNQMGFAWNNRYDDQLPFRRFFMRVESNGEKTIPDNFTTNDNFNIREYFKVLCHVHIVPLDSTWWREHIAFRNRLRSDEKDRLSYQNLKLELATKSWDDPNHYGRAKTALIQSILANADESSSTC